MKQVKILGTGKYLPQNKITNEKLEKELNLEENYIKKMTGIEERYYIKNETIEEMALKAVKNILEKNKRKENEIIESDTKEDKTIKNHAKEDEIIKNETIKIEDVELIIVATTTPNKYMPGIANYIQKELKIPNCNAYDILAGCNGFVNAFDIASTYIQTGKIKKALVIGVDVLSQYTDPKDKGTAIILSDGAGAILLKAQEESQENVQKKVQKKAQEEMQEKERKYFSKIVSEGKKNEILTINNGEKIYMNGKEIYKYAVTETVKIIEDVINEANITLEEVKYIIPHQSNERIIKAIASRLKIPKEKIYTNIKNTGNTFCASIPIALDQMLEEDLLKEGDKIILLGYGGGLNTGAILLGI